MGTGGFGEIYLATEGGKGEQRVVKIEPHENGPLFVEMHFYIEAGKPEQVAEYRKSRKGQTAPRIPLLRGHGSYLHKGTDKYRFLVIDRLGPDLDKIFQNGASPLSLAQASSIAVQAVDSLEYIHSAGYTHNDIKAANLLFGAEADSKDVYLVDFGLCVKYLKSGGHKEYMADPGRLEMEPSSTSVETPTLAAPPGEGWNYFHKIYFFLIHFTFLQRPRGSRLQPGPLADRNSALGGTDGPQESGDHEDCLRQGSRQEHQKPSQARTGFRQIFRGAGL